VELGRILAVLRGLVGSEIETAPTLARASHRSRQSRSAEGRGPENLLRRPGKPEVFPFALVDSAGRHVGSSMLDASAFDWRRAVDADEEVPEVASGWC
jgi:hypothetical protein